MRINYLLRQIGLMVGASRPPLPKLMNSSLVRESKNFARLWIRTHGCSHSIKNGGCVPCDYWTGDKITPEEQLDALTRELERLEKNPPRVLLLNTNGSVFDEHELGRNIRIKILEELRNRIPDTILILETRVETINESVLKDLKIFPSDKIMIEVGVETASPIINLFCCNKGLDISAIPTVVRQLQSQGIRVLANVMIGLPFLSAAEIVSDAHNTVHWCFANGVTTCVLFPVNIKPYTTLHWLYRHGFYDQVSLWSLVDVLASLEPGILKNIEISWYPGLEQIQHPHYHKPIVTPSTCPHCAQKVNDSLSRFAMSPQSRCEEVRRLVSIHCRCRDDWKRELSYDNQVPLTERLQDTYFAIAREAFGEKCFLENKHIISKELSAFNEVQPHG